MSTWKKALKSVASAAVAVALGGAISTATLAAESPIKVGVLHSLSGTMAISESALKDTILMLIEEQNKNGGVLGRQLEAVVMDPASDWPTYGTMAQEMIENDGVFHPRGSSPSSASLFSSGEYLLGGRLLHSCACESAKPASSEHVPGYRAGREPTVHT